MLMAQGRLVRATVAAGLLLLRIRAMVVAAVVAQQQLALR
jgi:hypothetical protein